MPKTKKEKSEISYPIKVVTYVETKTGEIYPDNFEPAYLRGKPKYAKTKKSEKVVNTTWSKIKEKVINQSSKNNNTYVSWKEPKGKRLMSVTKMYDDHKEVIYYNPVKK